MKFKGTFLAPMLVISVLLLLIASRFLDLSMLAYHENICLAVIVIQLLILIVPTVIYSKLRGEGFMKRLRVAPFGIEKLLVTLLAALTLFLGDTLIKLALCRVGLIDGIYTVYDYYLSGEETNVVYLLLTFGIVPAVAEELLFRGVLCADYESNGAVTAAVASALLYAMFGLSFGYFPVYFFAGLIFALVMYMSRSVLAAMLCHLIYNVANLVLGDTLWTIISKPQSMTFLIFVVGGLFLASLASLFGECERIYYGYSLANKSSDYVKGCEKFNAGRFFEALLAPPFLLALLVFVVAALQFM